MALSYAISLLPAIVSTAAGDLGVIVDVSDFTEAPTGTTKKITIQQLFTSVPSTASFASTVTVSGLTTLNGGVVVAGNGTISGSWTANSLAVTNAATIGGTLGVTGIATFGTINVNIANVTNVAAGASGVTSTGGLTISAGATALLNTGVTGTLSVSQTLTVAGVLTGNGSIRSVAPAGGTAGIFVAGINTVTNGFTVNTDASDNISYSFQTKTGANGLAISAAGDVSSAGSITGASLVGPLTGIVTVATGTGAAGRLYKTATNGLVFRATAGSLTDFALLDPTGSAIATVLTGAPNIRFEGTVTTPSAVNADTLTAVTSATITGVNGSPALTLTHGNIAVSDGAISCSTTGTFSGDATGNLILPHRTAPGLPANGALWTTTAGLFVRINGVTVGPLS